ncbi:MAG: hypothetical protein LBN38_08125 [Verrucomicrobiota bacterium]|jgi:ATP-dependent protease HslVU (ClpYQ) peptidase subunit|nr:hypothetical protein [Verrucomicrobiota bacterium]
MARKNRKNNQDSHRVLLWAVAFGMVAATLAVIYLSLLNNCETIGRQIKKLEQEQAELQKRVVNEERNWATARSIRNMERLMAVHGIVMSWPEERHIIRLHAGEEDAPAQYAQGFLMRRD